MTEKRKSPALRFRGYTDDWEQRKVSDLAEKTYGGGTPTTSNEAYWNGDIPWIQSSDVMDGKLLGVEPRKWITQAGLNNSAAQLIPENSIAIITRVGVGKLAFMPYSYATSQDFLSLSKLNAEPFFTVYACYKELQTGLNAVQGTSIKGITKDELLAKNIMVPRYAEQRRIGAYFKQLDNLITLHQRKLEKLKLVKKSMLEKMFPKNGSSVPEIRFKGFTDDWEQRKLGEYVSITSGEAPSKFEEGTELYVKVDDLNYNDKYVVDTQNKVAEHSTVKRVTKGSVVFPKRGAAIMTNKVRIMGIDSYMDTNMMALTSEKLDSEFLYNIISKEGLYKIADTSTIPQINNKHVEPYEVTIPSLAEQRRIGAYFKQLDNLITLHQRKVEKLQIMKKSMLEKMFV